MAKASEKSPTKKKRGKNGGARPGSGRKPYKPNEDQRSQVEMLSGLGVPHKHIAALIKIDDDTLRKYFRSELTEGKAKANSKISQCLFQAAVNGCATRQIFWAKTQMGWRDVSKIEHSGPDGGPLEFTEIQSVIVDPKPESDDAPHDD